MRDPHVDNLLVFPQGTDLHDHVLYTKGDIILQDKVALSSIINSELSLYESTVPKIAFSL